MQGPDRTIQDVLEAEGATVSEELSRVLAWAEEEARKHRRHSLTREMFLIAMLSDSDCWGLQIFQRAFHRRKEDPSEPSLLSDLRKYFTLHEAPDDGDLPLSPEEIPLTPRAERALREALQYARDRGDSTLDSRHLMFVMHRDPDGFKWYDRFSGKRPRLTTSVDLEVVFDSLFVVSGD